MLVNLHVRNLALIEEADVDFTRGLNVITGETGAGKSLLLGSVNIALGGKFTKEMLRREAESAMVELVFHTDDETILKELDEMGYPASDNQIIISRKLTGSRVISRVNGETCTSAMLKDIAGLFINIHGQRENMTLLKAEKQLRMLDFYAKEELDALLISCENAYKDFRDKEKEVERFDMDEEARLREVSRLEYEINEIDEAALYEGKEAELAKKFILMSNSRKIVETLSRIHEYTGYDSGAGELISRAVREMADISGYDDALTETETLLNDIEALLSDANRQAASYLQDFSFSDQEYAETEERLDLIRRLESKYGKTEAKVLEYARKAKERLEFLSGYESAKKEAEAELLKAEKTLDMAGGKLSEMRKKCALNFCREVKKEMAELNFANNAFEIEFSKSTSYRRDGYDNIQIMISANPGEPVMELSKAASGGELSRIMLAIRTVLADSDNIGTVIFDEIDAGISGRTAQMVSEKMARIAKERQVLCVTHLAQIAAMADTHFLIEKTVEAETAKTKIRLLSKEEESDELARILGGTKLTETVYNNAKEMKQLANEVKENLRTTDRPEETSRC